MVLILGLAVVLPILTPIHGFTVPRSSSTSALLRVPASTPSPFSSTAGRASFSIHPNLKSTIFTTALRPTLLSDPSDKDSDSDDASKIRENFKRLDRPSSDDDNDDYVPNNNENENENDRSQYTSQRDPPNEAIRSLVTDVCILINDVMKRTVVRPVREYVEIRPGGTAKGDVLSKLVAPPEVPGIPRPVWLTILGSVPTALGWYGYYKFSVEEELFQYELQSTAPSSTKPVVTGLGGYGTLFPFVYGVIIGAPLQFLDLPIGTTILEASAVWILLSQINLYRRVNELCMERAEELFIVEAPLHAWWAILPPPLDVVVGLRQVHYLSEYWRVVRGEEYDKDLVAEDLFPFISRERFTLKEFFRTPSMWFWFTSDMKDFDVELLKDNKDGY